MAFMILFIWASSPETQSNASLPKLNNAGDFQAPHCLLKNVNFFLLLIKIISMYVNVSFIPSLTLKNLTFSSCGISKNGEISFQSTSGIITGAGGKSMHLRMRRIWDESLGLKFQLCVPGHIS